MRHHQTLSMQKPFRALVVAAGLLALGRGPVALGAPAGLTQTPPPADLEVVVNQVDFSHYPEVRLFVTVSGRSGAPVLGIPESSFSVTEDGAAKPITSVANVGDAPETTPMRMVLALDTSSSVRGQAIEDIKAAAKSFVAGLQPRDRIAQIAFSDDVRDLHPFTNNTTVMAGAIDGLTAGGGTALYEAIHRSAELVDQESGRRAFVLLTDGWNDTTLPRTLDQAAQRAVEAQAPGYVLGFGSAHHAALQRIADETNGRYMHRPTSEDVQALFTELTGLLSSQYVVTYMSEVPIDGKSHDFTVTVAHRGTRASGTKSVLLSDIVTVTPGPTPIGGTATPTRTVTPSVTPDDRQDDEIPPGHICTKRDASGLCIETCADADGDDACDPEPAFPMWIIGALFGALALALVAAGIRTRPRNGTRVAPQPSPPPSSGVDEPTRVPPAPVRYIQGQPHDTIIRRPGVATGWLIGLNYEVEHRRFPLSAEGRGETTFGRAPENTYTLDGGGTVSRHHALVKFEHGRFILRDLGARNPTKVNGTTVARHTLADGDQVAIGKLLFEFKATDSDAKRTGGKASA